MAFNPSIDVNSWKLIQWSADVPKLDVQLTELMLKLSTWATNVGQVVGSGAIPWSGITGKPATFPPSSYLGADSINSGAYAITVGSDFALTAGVVVYFTISNGNSGAPTLNVNGTGAKAIVNRANAGLITNELNPKTHAVVYDGTSWRLITPIARWYNATNPVNPTIECAGFDSVVVSANFNSATGAGFTLAHVTYGVPIFIDISNNTGAGMAYYVNGTNPGGIAFSGTYWVWTSAITGGGNTRFDSTSPPSLTSGLRFMAFGAAMESYLFFK